MQGLTPFQSNYNIEHLHALTSHSMLMPVLQQEESKLAPSLMVRSSPATTVRSPWCTWGLGGWRRGAAETACWWPHRLCTVLCRCQARPGGSTGSSTHTPKVDAVHVAMDAAGKPIIASTTPAHAQDVLQHQHQPASTILLPRGHQHSLAAAALATASKIRECPLLCWRAKGLDQTSEHSRSIPCNAHSIVAILMQPCCAWG